MHKVHIHVHQIIYFLSSALHIVGDFLRAIKRKSAFRLFAILTQRLLHFEDFLRDFLQRSHKQRSNECQINYLVSIILL